MTLSILKILIISINSVFALNYIQIDQPISYLSDTSRFHHDVRFIQRTLKNDIKRKRKISSINLSKVTQISPKRYYKFYKERIYLDSINFIFIKVKLRGHFLIFDLTNYYWTNNIINFIKLLLLLGILPFILYRSIAKHDNEIH